MKLNKKKLLNYDCYSYLFIYQKPCQSILIYKKKFNGFVPISRNQGFMGVCGNKGLPQKMEKIKLNEKLRLGRQSSLPRQSEELFFKNFSVNLSRYIFNITSAIQNQVTKVNSKRTKCRICFLYSFAF